VTSELIRGDGLFPPTAYTRHDETPDTKFYGYPRKVVHIDDGAIAALGRLYAEVLPAGGQLLDLMSSWRTHLPRGFRAGEVIGLGLNAEEMTDNPQLTDHVVHDLLLVRTYFETAGGWVDLTAEDRSPAAGDPLYAVWARKGSG
jgi:hypothetical protein